MAKFRFIAGAAAGAIAALMLSPKSGAENRALVAGKVEETIDKAPEPVQNIAEKVRARATVATEEAKPASDDIKAKINEARDRIVEQVTRSQEAKTVDADVTDAATEAEPIVITEAVAGAAAEAVDSIEVTAEEAVAEAVEAVE